MNKDEMLAKYVRDRYPSIERSVDYGLYKAIAVIKELGTMLPKNEEEEEDETGDI